MNFILLKSLVHSRLIHEKWMYPLTKKNESKSRDEAYALNSFDHTLKKTSYNME